MKILQLPLGGAIFEKEGLNSERGFRVYGTEEEVFFERGFRVLIFEVLDDYGAIRKPVDQTRKPSGKAHELHTILSGIHFKTVIR